METTRNKIMTYLLFCLTFEITLGGGGNIFFAHNISARYTLYLAMFAITFSTSKSINLDRVFFCIIAFMAYGSLLGIYFNNNPQKIFLDTKPFLYVLILPTLAEATKHIDTLSIFKEAVKISAKIMCVTYITYCVYINIFPEEFMQVYNTLSSSTEFIFRPSGLFLFKGFFFFGIAAIFFYVEKKYIWLALTMIAIHLTQTRGIIIGTCMAIASIGIRGKKYYHVFLTLSIMSISLNMIINTPGKRTTQSDAVRINDAAWIKKSFSSRITLDYLKLFFGHGFGAPINGRDKIENTYLDFFYKTGIASIILFKKITTQLLGRNTPSIYIGILVFLIIVSATNPFISSPMGIYIISILLVNRHEDFRKNLNLKINFKKLKTIKTNNAL